jgi:hypothetical protein
MVQDLCALAHADRVADGLPDVVAAFCQRHHLAPTRQQAEADTVIEA